MVEATAVHIIEFTCVESCHSSSEMYFLMGMVAGVTENFGPFCSKDFSSGVSSFLERIITHLSWILKQVEEVTSVESVSCFGGLLRACCGGSGDEVLELPDLVFLYCRNVFSSLLKIMFCRFVKVGSSSFCCWDISVLAISVWRWLILMFVYLILLWMSEDSAFFVMACSNLLPFHLICKGFGVTLFPRHLRLQILAVLDLANCISNFFNFLVSSRVSWL